MEKQIYHTRLDRGVTPDEIIGFIDEQYPDAKGLCYYEDKQMKSREPGKVAFYFDPYHSVVEVTFYKWTWESFEEWMKKNGLHFQDEHIIYKGGRLGITVNRQKGTGEIEEAIKQLSSIKK